MKKSICILLVLLLLCACAPQATSSTEPSSVTSSGQLHGIMSVPLLSMISVDYSISVPNETPSSEPSTVTSAPNISAVSSEEFSVPSTEVSQVPSTRSRPQKVEGDPADYYPPYKFYPLQYADPFTDDFDSLVALLDDPVRTKDGPLSEEDVKQLLKVTLPLAMRLEFDIRYPTLENGRYAADINEFPYYYVGEEHPYHFEISGNDRPLIAMQYYLEKVYTRNRLFSDDNVRSTFYWDAFYANGCCYIQINNELAVLSFEHLYSSPWSYQFLIDTAKIVSQDEDELLIEIDYVCLDNYPTFRYYRKKLKLWKEPFLDNKTWLIDTLLTGYSIRNTELWYVEMPRDYNGK